MNWINENKEWIFDGIGVAILGGLGTFVFWFLRKRGDTGASQKQSGGKKSTNIQAGRDIHINSNGEDDDG